MRTSKTSLGTCGSLRKLSMKKYIWQSSLYWKNWQKTQNPQWGISRCRITHATIHGSVYQPNRAIVDTLPSTPCLSNLKPSVPFFTGQTWNLYYVTCCTSFHCFLRMPVSYFSWEDKQFCMVGWLAPGWVIGICIAFVQQPVDMSGQNRMHWDLHKPWKG